MLSLSLARTQRLAPRERAGPTPQTPPPAARAVALPRVPIHDTQALDRLRQAGTPHQVVCELPAQLPHLIAYGEQIRDLRLILAPTDDTYVQAFESACFEGLRQCPSLKSLAVQHNSKASPSFFDALCERLAGDLRPSTLLELSFRGMGTTESLHGMKSLLCSSNVTRLVLHGSLAVSAALNTLAQCRPGKKVVPTSLHLSGFAFEHDHALRRLARVRQPKMHLHLYLDEACEPEAFMDWLLNAGVSPKQPLTVHAPDGRSLSLQECLNACCDRHLDRLVQALGTHPDRQRAYAECLQQCQTLGTGGPQLFAWACSIALSAQSRALPEVPMSLPGYVSALGHMGVKHVLSCVLPAHADSLSACDPAHIHGLRLHAVGTTSASNQDMLKAALARMTALRHCALHQAFADLRYTRWLLACLNDLPIELLQLEFAGEAVDQALPAMTELLENLPRLRVLVCQGPLAASLAAKALQALGFYPKPLWLSLTLPPQGAAQLAQWMQGIRAPWLGLDLHFLAPVDLMAVATQIHQCLEADPSAFQIAWLDMKSPSDTLAHQHPLKCKLAELQIRTPVPSIWIDNAPVLAHDIKPQPTVGAFLKSIGTGLDDEQRSEDQHRRIQQAIPDLADLKIPLATLLDPKTLLALSSLNKASRAHFHDLAVAAHQAAQIWLRNMGMLQVPPEHRRLVLLELFGEAPTRLIMNADA